MVARKITAHSKNISTSNPSTAVANKQHIKSEMMMMTKGRHPPPGTRHPVHIKPTTPFASQELVGLVWGERGWWGVGGGASPV